MIAGKKIKELRGLQQQFRETREEIQGILNKRQEIENEINRSEGLMIIKRWEDLKALREKEKTHEEELKALSKYRDFPVNYYEEIVSLEGIIQKTKEE